MYALYSALLSIGLMAVAPVYLLKSKAYRATVRERFGFLRMPSTRGRRAIWLHAVSVGEARAVEGLVARLRKAFPGRPLVVSTTTMTGQQVVLQRGDMADHTFYFPVDLTFCLRRVFDHVDPSLILIAETELWPNLARLARERSIPMGLVNGVVSDRSFRWYRRLRFWLSDVLSGYVVIGVQSERDRLRMIEMGAPPDRTIVFGNLKFDTRPPAKPLASDLRHMIGSFAKSWIAASTVPGEEELVLDAYRKVREQHPDLRLVLAPRHPERFDEVEQLIGRSGFRSVRRSSMNGSTPDVLLLDSIGELASLYEFADVVFVGGSLVPRGGHNIIEPAAFAKPVLFGPHVFNQRDITRIFLEDRSAMQVADAVELASAVAGLLAAPDAAHALGDLARQTVERNRGAADRITAHLARSAAATT